MHIVLTGGPCGGKSTAQSAIMTWLSKAAIPTYLLPEVPTIVMKCGFPYPGTAPHRQEELHAFEAALFDIALAFEDNTAKVAEARATAASAGADGNPAYVVVHDRGLVDMAAYCPPDLWQRMLGARGMTHSDLLARYDHVIHLSSAALGAEHGYTLANNAARTETPEHARELDAAIMRVYVDHRSRHVIAAERDFRVKLLALERAMTQLVGATAESGASSASVQLR